MSLPTPVSTQVQPDALLYVNGMSIAWTSNTSLTVAAGQCRDSSNETDILVSASTVINTSAANGLNALDTGVRRS